jgi:acyl-CoA hydrolase
VDLASLLRPGARVAVADGLGRARSHFGELSDAAAAVGGVRLLLGWMPRVDAGLRLDAFDDIRTVMSGWGLRGAVDAGSVHALPVRLSAVPSLLHGPLRPDVLLASVVRRPDGGWGFGTEVAWMRAAVDAGATVAGVVAERFPSAGAEPPLPDDAVVIVGSSAAEPDVLAPSAVNDDYRAIGERIAGLVPEGARLQVGPGPLGRCVLDAIRVPIGIDSGLVPDAVVDLERRGLLLGEPVATYLAGGPELYAWADGRPILHRLEYTHDLGRLFHGRPLVAVNTVVEIDEQAQVNVEAAGGSTLGGIGGHSDYAAAGARSVGGLSIVATTSAHRGARTLVPRLSAPVSTPGQDVDIVVTEFGAADLRGLDRAEKRAALHQLFDRS